MTLFGAMQPSILRLFIQNSEDEYIKPSAKTIGWMKYSTYTILASIIYCFIFFTLEAFTFFNPLLWLLKIAGSALLTIIILIAIERIKK